MAKPAIDQEYAEMTAKALRNQQAWSVDREVGCENCAATLNAIAATGGTVESVTMATADPEVFVIIWYRYV